MSDTTMKQIHPDRQNTKKTSCADWHCILVCVFSLAACQAQNYVHNETPDTTTLAAPSATATSIIPPTAQPSHTAICVSTPSPTATSTITPTPPTWKSIARGITQTYLAVPVLDSDALSYVYALRIDPTAVSFRVHYDQSEPHTIEEWQVMTGAPIIVNGGFFGGNNAPVGRIVIDGQILGVPLDYSDSKIGIPGLFATTDGKAEIYALGRASYNPHGLRFDQAIESYPMLLLPGGQPMFLEETGHRARRTVIAIDEQGYVLFLLSDIPLFSLHELSNWLGSSGLGLDMALNLDGGRSSGIGVNLPGESKVISALVVLPIVIGIYAN